METVDGKKCSSGKFSYAQLGNRKYVFTIWQRKQDDVKKMTQENTAVGNRAGKTLLWKIWHWQTEQ
jgi:hypothetical protein